MSKKVKIGLLGIGTVGSGVLETLVSRAQEDNNFMVEIKKIAERDANKVKWYPELPQEIFTTDVNDLINDPEIKIMVELIGGVNPAFEFIKKAIQNKKHIVTANKELIAKHGREIFKLAEENNVVVMYEAAVGGGIPIILPLRQSLAGNNVSQISGILNGTTNYILTKMEKEGKNFEEVLEEAQKLGYAEADPTGDVQGYDAAYKIAILASLAFNKNVDINAVYKEGIDKITIEDISYADEFGYKIKLIALVKNCKDDSLDIRVHPMLVSKKHPISGIDDVLNAVVIDGEPVSRVMFSGPGAGKFPTASSVIGDIMCIASEIANTEEGCLEQVLPMMHHDKVIEDAAIRHISETENKYYISVTTQDMPGVIGELGTISGKNGINLYSIIQKGLLEDGSARIVLLTESAKEDSINKAVEEIKNTPSIKNIESFMRVMD